jgi:hypothetical protein
MIRRRCTATKFAGLMMAAENEEEASYLATQQADEARHMQFYARFQDEVIAKVACVTTYHLVIESVLGLTAFEFITHYLRDNDAHRGSSRKAAVAMAVRSPTFSAS